MDPRNLGIRLDPDLSRRLADFEARTGVGATTLGRQALIAALDHYEACGSITFPLRLVSAAVLPRQVTRLNDEAEVAVELTQSQAALIEQGRQAAAMNRQLDVAASAPAGLSLAGRAHKPSKPPGKPKAGH